MRVHKIFRLISEGYRPTFKVSISIPRAIQWRALAAAVSFSNLSSKNHVTSKLKASSRPVNWRYSVNSVHFATSIILEHADPSRSFTFICRRFSFGSGDLLMFDVKFSMMVELRAGINYCFAMFVAKCAQGGVLSDIGLFFPVFLPSHNRMKRNNGCAER